MAYKEKEYRKRMSLAHARNALITLISINLVVFVVLAFAKAFIYLRYPDQVTASNVFSANIVSWFGLSGNFSSIAHRPWTILSHLFTQVNVWRLVGNMLWLWLFGSILQDLTGNRKIIPVFFYGSIAGAVGFVLTLNLVPSLRPLAGLEMLLGPDAGVMAIAIATTTVSPGYRIFPMLNGGLPIWILTAIYVVADIATVSFNDPAHCVAHLAGALTGFLFIYSFRRGIDWGGWINNFFDWVNDLFNPEKPKKGKIVKQELFYRSPVKPFTRTSNVTTQRIDEILDKISQRGIHSLTDEEKELLKRASKDVD